MSESLNSMDSLQNNIDIFSDTSNLGFDWIWILEIIIIILFIIGIIWWVSQRNKPKNNKFMKTYHVLSPLGDVTALTAVTGTGILEPFEYISKSVDNNIFPHSKIENPVFDKSSPYLSVISIPVKLNSFQDTSIEKDQFLNYFKSVYYSSNLDKLKKLTLGQLRGWYRSQIFYIISGKSQPDGGWNGPYWNTRIIENVYHNKANGCNFSSAKRNEVLLNRGLWKNRMFTEPLQSSLRRGMRNSTQVLAEMPMWTDLGQQNVSYGTGGFSEFVYIEMVQIPNSAGRVKKCASERLFFGGLNQSGVVKCPKQDSYNGYPCSGNSKRDGHPLFQPTRNMKTVSSTDPQTFYFAQGSGQFYNTGRTAYAFNYVDMFLNSPMGKIPGETITGWSRIPGHSQGGLLGFLPGTQTPKEHDYEDPIYSIKLILEYLSRVNRSGKCMGELDSKKAMTDPNTGLPGLKKCLPDFLGNCTGCFCTAKGCNGSSFGSTTSLDKQAAALMGYPFSKNNYYNPYWDPYSQNSPDAWNISCVPTCYGPIYPKRNSMDSTLIDNRYMATGWVNGNFYGYPMGDCLCNGSNPNICTLPPTSLGGNENHCDGQCNPYRSGIPGIDPDTGDIIYGKIFTSEKPLIYYDHNKNPICRTWYRRRLDDMCLEAVQKGWAGHPEEVALKLLAEMYSCGDTGSEVQEYNWPFGTYFSSSNDLIIPGKELAKQLNVSTLQLTMTPSNFISNIIRPAYNFEVMFFPLSLGDPSSSSCASAVTLDITSDFDGKEQEPGSDLRRLCNLNKGRFGGFVDIDSPAGKSARAFDGSERFSTLANNKGNIQKGDCEGSEVIVSINHPDSIPYTIYYKTEKGNGCDYNNCSLSGCLSNPGENKQFRFGIDSGDYNDPNFHVYAYKDPNLSQEIGHVHIRKKTTAAPVTHHTCDSGSGGTKLITIQYGDIKFSGCPKGVSGVYQFDYKFKDKKFDTHEKYINTGFNFGEIPVLQDSAVIDSFVNLGDVW